ncbi:hypothetical protein CPC08DRAFT_709184 [Agrocybe pediades]|nr:hypothetical protein CPC08DRAFT_709184 [Agrocybe pediades]
MSAASPLPPNSALPKFDSTLGALYIGLGAATVLYGVSCLQLFIYTTGTRSSSDKTWLRSLVWFTLAISTAEQIAMMAGMYKDLVTDFLNPLALPAHGPGSAQVFIYVESLLLTCISVLIQWFFCWRIWAITASSFSIRSRVAFTVLTVTLSLFSFATNIDLAINGFNHRVLSGNPPGLILAFKLSTSAQIAYDVIVTAAMTWSLQRARMGIKRKDHVIRIITLFTINTNLLTTLLAIAELVTFLTLPHATVYGGIGFLLGKTYFNSFLAVLNARDYLREKYDNAANTTVTYPEFSDQAAEGDTEDTMPGPYALTSLSDMRFAPSKVDTPRVA